MMINVKVLFKNKITEVFSVNLKSQIFIFLLHLLDFNDISYLQENII